MSQFQSCHQPQGCCEVQRYRHYRRHLSSWHSFEVIQHTRNGRATFLSSYHLGRHNERSGLRRRTGELPLDHHDADSDARLFFTISLAPLNRMSKPEWMTSILRGCSFPSIYFTCTATSSNVSCCILLECCPVMGLLTGSRQKDSGLE